MYKCLFSVLVSYTLAQDVYFSSTEYDDGAYGIAPNQSFHSDPSLFAPIFNVKTRPTGNSDSSLPYVALSYQGRLTDQKKAPMIMSALNDSIGELVWQGPAGPNVNTQVQTYKNQSVITFWTGSTFSGGYGYGNNLVYNSSYDVIANMSNIVNGTYQGDADFHEFKITSNDTALLLYWPTVAANLTSVGGPADGYVFDCIFQEIDIASNSLVYEWSAIEHIPIDETYFEIADNAGNSSTNPFDWCHMNSVDKDTKGNYIVSLRGPSTVYNISGSDGSINWRLNGKSSNFTMGTNATFYAQHDARLWDDETLISVFDNGGTSLDDPKIPAARVLYLRLDIDNKTATVEQSHNNPAGIISASQGSSRRLSNGNSFAGWGIYAAFTEFTESGETTLDVHFSGNDTQTVTPFSYRAFKVNWTGQPTTIPSAAIVSSSGNSTLYVSWNGATEVAAWQLHTSTDENSNFATGGTTAKSGFETAIPLSNVTGLVYATAHNLDGTCIGASQIYSISTGNSTGKVATCDTTNSAGAASYTSDAAAPTGTTTTNNNSTGAGNMLQLQWSVLAVVMVVGLAVVG